MTGQHRDDDVALDDVFDKDRAIAKINKVNAEARNLRKEVKRLKDIGVPADLNDLPYAYQVISLIEGGELDDYLIRFQAACRRRMQTPQWLTRTRSPEPR